MSVMASSLFLFSLVEPQVQLVESRNQDEEREKHGSVDGATAAKQVAELERGVWIQIVENIGKGIVYPVIDNAR